MKNLSVWLMALSVAVGTASAQVRVNNPKQTVERNAEWRVNNKIDQGVNKVFDKAEEGIGNIFKKKDKTKKDSKDNTKGKEGAGGSQGSEDAANTETADGKASQRSGTSGGAGVGGGTVANDQPKTLKSYSKFDFVPGEKIIALEDFTQDAVGDFPAKWNTNASGEVVNLDGIAGKWLQFAKNGVFYPEFVKELPENFTVEFDMIASADMSVNMSGLKVYFPEISERKLTFDQDFGTVPQAGIDLHPTNETSTSSVWVFDKNSEKLLENTNPLAWNNGQVNRISIWKQKTRLRIYVNETKIWDLPRAFDSSLKYSMLFATHIFEGTVYLANLRTAVGAPDTRSKLITEGKFSTTGILFDVNSDKIKPESYGVLKELGTVLKENPAVKVRIIGHTDADGDDAKNLDLSKRRAASVKASLQSEFGIEASRMDTDGKGETQPVGPNTTPEGKANNRRVEFVKL